MGGQMGSTVEVNVEVVQRHTGEIVKALGPMSPRKADKVERGIEINLNHTDYVVRRVPATGK